MFFSSGRTSPYQILGITHKLSNDEIKKAYRKLVMQHHPDLGGDANMVVVINEAYSALKKKRGL
ncbi:MAG: hypothetical protein COV36_04310 [Alphaproteobacteria bacterium CG11_big_fil_rev_8_21_14_0_20_44_7]|nr:MAG: hypothetical protein COV36_04310 [Alphaproteobacteria bacterium CG11_big_fil_rev_8_21_14_0_20_44_7]